MAKGTIEGAAVDTLRGSIHTCAVKESCQCKVSNPRYDRESLFTHCGGSINTNTQSECGVVLCMLASLTHPRMGREYSCRCNAG
jgi:hypothetical protein